MGLYCFVFVMKKSTTFFGVITAVLLLVSGCKKEPFACFVNPGLVEVNEPITFQNCSRDGETYYWWFGDGDVSYEKIPTKAYTQRGKWLAYLTVTSNDGEFVSKFNEIIEVGNRFFSGFELKNISFTNQGGQAWDTTGAGPDLLIRYGQAKAGGSSWITAERPDMMPDSFPVIYPNLIDIMFTDEPWYFTIVDIDIAGEDTLYSWTINPTTLEWKSPMVLRDTLAGQYELDILFEIR